MRSVTYILYILIHTHSLRVGHRYRVSALYIHINVLYIYHVCIYSVMYTYISSPAGAFRRYMYIRDLTLLEFLTGTPYCGLGSISYIVCILYTIICLTRVHKRRLYRYILYHHIKYLYRYIIFI